jgi:hypothetical protein
LFGIYSSYFANLLPYIPVLLADRKIQSRYTAVRQIHREDTKVCSSTPHPAHHGEIPDECSRRGTSVQEARGGKFEVSQRYCCLSIEYSPSSLVNCLNSSRIFLSGLAVLRISHSLSKLTMLPPHDPWGIPCLPRSNAKPTSATAPSSPRHLKP